MSIFCTNCGKENSEEDKYCIFCGRLLDKPEIQSIPPVVLTPPSPEPSTQPIPAPLVSEGSGFEIAGDL